MVEAILRDVPRMLTAAKIEEIRAKGRRIRQQVRAVSSGLQQAFYPNVVSFPLTPIFEGYYLDAGMGAPSEESVKNLAAQKQALEWTLREVGDLLEPKLVRAIANWCVLDDVESEMWRNIAGKNEECDPAIAVMASRAEQFLAGREARLLMAGASLVGSQWVQWFNPKSGSLIINDQHPFVLQFARRMIEWHEAENVSAWGGDFFRNNLPVSGFNVVLALDFVRVQSEEQGVGRFFRRANRLLGYGNEPGCVIILDLAQGYKVPPRLFEWITTQGEKQGFVVKEQESLKLIFANEGKVERDIIVLEQS